MTSLWSSDIHLNEVPRDRYRWDILPWLDDTATELKADFIGLAGDTTDAKDRHPASLVNRLTDFFASSPNRWVVLAGNHDMISADTPFFRYLRHLDNVTFVYKPKITKLPVDGTTLQDVLFLPATKEWQTLWQPFLEYHYDYIFMHGTFAGTQTETGFELPGIPVDYVPPDSYGRLYSGDVHSPGPIFERAEYIGAPYRTHFGDTYTPRVVFLGRDGANDIHPPLKSRHLVTVRGGLEPAEWVEVKEGDQVKLRVRLKRNEFPEWRKIKSETLRIADAQGWEVCGIELVEVKTTRRRLGDPPDTQPVKKTPEEIVRDYAALQKLKAPDLEYGLTFLKG